MAILMTVIGGVYGIAQGAMSLGKSMAEARVHDSRLTNFVSAWREYLETLPPDTQITVGEKPSRKWGRGSLLFEGGSPPFAWTREVRLAPAAEFKLVKNREAAQGSDLIVRHLRKPERATSPNDYEVIAEMPILEGLREFSWQFYNADKKKWVTLWEDQPAPPLFMRLSIAFMKEPRDKRYEYTFWFSGGSQINEAGAPGKPVLPPGGVPNGNPQQPFAPQGQGFSPIMQGGRP